MNHDPTEDYRRAEAAALNNTPGTREQLEAAYGEGNVWGTEELREDFIVQGFAAPFCIVQRKSDGAIGTVSFQHDPRFYFDFQEDR